MDTKTIIFQIVILEFVVCADSAEVLEPGTLELWVGRSATLTCLHRGQSGTQEVNDRVFALRTPKKLETTLITEDHVSVTLQTPIGLETILTEDSPNAKYFMASGKINLINTGTAIIPERRFYLGITQVSEDDDGMKVICISNKDSKDSDILDEEFQYFATTLKVRHIEDCQTSSSEPNFLITTKKTTIMEETTIMTSGTSDAVTSRRDSLTTGKTDKALPNFDESDPDRGARKQNGGHSEANSAEQSEANSTEKGLDTMTLAVIVLAACFGTMILTLAACAVLYYNYKYRLNRTKYMSSGSHSKTTVIEMQTEDESNGHNSTL